MDGKKIGVLVGSLRKASFTKKIAETLCAVMPEGFETYMLEIGNLPIYNQDYDDEGRVPAEYTAFREKLKGMDGFLFVTPEYNRSMPAVLKNALDTGSRPYGQNCWNGKPAAIISVSPGAIGGFGANHHLRQSAVTVNLIVMPQPEAYVSNVTTVLDADGNVAQKTKEFLQVIANAYGEWVKR